LSYAPLGRFGFAQHGEDQLQVGHVVAQVVAGLHHVQSFELAVLAGRHAKGGAGNFGGEYRILFALGHAACFPLVGQLPTHGDGTQPLLDPRLRIALGLIQLAGTGAGQFGVFYFFDTLVTHLRQPAFERLGLGRRDGLDDAEQAFSVGAIGLAFFAVRGLQRKGGTSCTPVGIERRVTAAHFLNVLPWV
jgi:hypothetical protein